MLKMKRIVIAFVLVAMTMVAPMEVFALNDGAYVVSRSTTYANPVTGTTEDGGTNIALGNSMVANVVADQLLLEKVNGTYYVTIGLGLASATSNVRFQVLNGDGSLSSVGATVTGSHYANGDTVNHYRIQLSSPDVYISPRMYVGPMGRDVQFFVLPNSASASPGTGYYNSLMVSETTGNSGDTNETQTAVEEEKEKKEEAKEEEEEIERTKVGSISKKDLFKDVSGLTAYVVDKDGKVNPDRELTAENLKQENDSSKKEKGSNKNLMMIVIGLAVVVLIIGAGGLFYVKKVKK